MAYYEMMPAGLPAGLQSGMDSVLNKKFGTATSYAPGTWPDTVNLMGPLPEKTIVSSPVADFQDGADDVPTSSVKVTIPPTLSGVSSVTETQTGRNLLLPYNADSAEITVNGIKRSYSLDNQEFTFEGTNTKTDASWLIFSINASDFSLNGLKTGVTYRFSHNFTADMYAQFTYNKSGGGIGAMGYLRGNAGQNASVSFTLPSDFSSLRQFQIGVSNTAGAINITAHFQVEFGSTTHDFEQYQTPTTYTAQLGRTVYGGTADLVNGTAEPTNWLDNTLTTQTVNGTTFTVNADKSITVSGTPSQQTRVYISQESITINDAMFFSFGTMPTGTRVFCSRTSGGATSYPTISPSHTATLDAVYTNFLLEIGTSFDGTAFTIYPLCNNGTSASDYSPYFEPFTFTGQEINTRLGYNAFWSDQGDTEVTYRADINLVLQALSGLRGLMMARPQLEPETEPEETTEETPEEMER